jgi:4-hydroxy-tetrahydrodipicolinate synthase
MPALVTPFKNGAVDLDGFAAHVEWQIAEGSHGLVPVGTTGESPTLAHDEHYAVITACVEVAALPKAARVEIDCIAVLAS